MEKYRVHPGAYQFTSRPVAFLFTSYPPPPPPPMNQLNVSGYPTADHDLAYLSTNPLVYLVAYLNDVVIYISGSIEMSDKL